METALVGRRLHVAGHPSSVAAAAVAVAPGVAESWWSHKELV